MRSPRRNRCLRAAADQSVRCLVELVVIVRNLGYRYKSFDEVIDQFDDKTILQTAMMIASNVSPRCCSIKSIFFHSNSSRSA